MNLSTPPQPRLRDSSSSSSSGSNTPYTPTNARAQRQFASGRPFAPPGLRDRGTPVGKVLAREGVPTRSPRKIRSRSWTEKAQDWPSNLLLSLETSLQVLSLDPAGYPLAVGLNALHLLTRLPVFVAALPPWMRFGGGGGSSAHYLASARDLQDADQRLEAMRRQAQGSRLSWGWWAAGLSVLLVLISFANAAYLFSRRRRYHLVLRQDPLASPNARSANLDFSPPQERLGLLARLKKSAKQLIWKQEEEEPNVFKVQQLDVWTPEYVLWSSRLFTLYPPPLALMYHFLRPSTFFPFLLIGGFLTFQTFALVYLYTTLLSDRAQLQAEVMHEYNVKFVNPRVFVQKRDACTSTTELEYSEWKGVLQEEERRKAAGGVGVGRETSVLSEEGLGEEALDALVRGSGRKARRARESTTGRRFA